MHFMKVQEKPNYTACIVNTTCLFFFQKVMCVGGWVDGCARAHARTHTRTHVHAYFAGFLEFLILPLHLGRLTEI